MSGITVPHGRRYVQGRGDGSSFLAFPDRIIESGSSCFLRAVAHAPAWCPAQAH
ncbi:hypothetical protein [Thermogemmatispora sp.]|uniref:hypothetical protein n=1 Tax=Thermogemmatispora sp. TaxID=1968838 RepID=UPI0035E4258E